MHPGIAYLGRICRVRSPGRSCQCQQETGQLKNKGKPHHRHGRFPQSTMLFSMALQVASLVGGVFHTDLLNTFTLLSIATNSILPMVFSLLFVVRYGRSSIYLLVLTTLTWTLASIVFWGPYSNIPVSDTPTSSKGFDMQMAIQLSIAGIPACGGYSAIGACPDLHLAFNVCPVW